MSQQQFDQFMQDQMQAIVDAGMADTPEVWIEQHAEEFRQQWEESHHA